MEGKKPSNLIIEDNTHFAKGAYGVIFRGSMVTTNGSNILVAIKRQKDYFQEDLTQNTAIQLMAEISALKKLSNKYIIECISIFYEDVFVYMVFPYCIKNLSIIMSMPHFLHKNRLILDLILQVGTALKFLHSNRIVHRDIKPENILLLWEKKQFVVKVADFGSCVHSNVSYQKNGSAAYMSPEFFISSKATHSSFYYRTDFRMDYWGLGVSLYLLVTKKFPFTKNGKPAHVYSEWVEWLGDVKNEMRYKESLFNRKIYNKNGKIEWRNNLRGIDMPDICRSISIENELLIMLIDGLLSVQPFYRWNRRDIDFCRESLPVLNETIVDSMHMYLFNYIQKL